MPDAKLTDAELAALQQLDALSSVGFGSINGIPLYVLADALRELAALRSQLAAEREKRAALVAEWRASDGDHYYLAGLEFCADQLEALDKETGDA